MRISDWSSDVCSSDLPGDVLAEQSDGSAADRDEAEQGLQEGGLAGAVGADDADQLAGRDGDGHAVEDVHLRHVDGDDVLRSEERSVGKKSVSTGRSLGRP